MRNLMGRMSRLGSAFCSTQPTQTTYSTQPLAQKSRQRVVLIVRPIGGFFISGSIWPAITPKAGRLSSDNITPPLAPTLTETRSD